MQGERSMSLGRKHPGAFRLRRWPGGDGLLPGIEIPARLDRFFAVMQGERSMSIGRCGPGEFRLRRWRRGYRLLPGDRHPPLALTAFCGHARRAVDVNRPVTPGAFLLRRWRRGADCYRGLTSPARLYRFLWSCQASGRCQSAGNTPVRSGCGDGGAGADCYRGIDIPRSPLPLFVVMRGERSMSIGR
jgi:hypothetical protein